MKRILFVGEHPLAVTGNGGMMESILSSVDATKYTPICFALEPTPIDPLLLSINPIPFPIISSPSDDPSNQQKLLSLLNRGNFDAVFMVGLDIWNYLPILEEIKNITSNRGIPWISLFPYDVQELRKDWVKWIGKFDFPCVYSRYGYELLKDAVPKTRYFRPQLQGYGLWERLGNEERESCRRFYFPSVGNNTFIFGFVGVNQIRKDPQLAIKAYSIVRKELEKEDIDARLYLHTNLNSMYNIKQYAIDCNLKTNDLWTKKSNTQTPLSNMVKLYNSLDCLVNCSLQEGLSWTLVEAMLCGLPFIASKTTAQIELLESAGYSIPCEEPTYLPMVGSEGQTWVDAKRCKLSDLVEAMFDVATSGTLREKLILDGLKAGKEWLDGVSDVNEVLNEACFPKMSVVSKIEPAILFAQHSSAGDVLMTTQCFKGIKEKHKGLPLVYMTSEQFMDIVEGNPYVDKIIPWEDSNLSRRFSVVYNPHGEKILPGRFNSLDTKLYEMYPYFCKVKADKIYIDYHDTREDLKSLLSKYGPYVVVHTTGGARTRVYSHMDKVINKLPISVVQIGGGQDYACKNIDLDLRGKLTWRETAYVMSQAEAAVVIDSYPAHLAGAVDTPVVVLFGPAPARVTGPRSDNAPVICIEPNHLDVCPQVGFCYSGDCANPCINTINPMKVRSELMKLIKVEKIARSA